MPTLNTLLLSLFLLLLPLLHAHPLTRQSRPSAPAVPPEFNINAGAGAVGRFIAEDPQWLFNAPATSTFVTPDAIIGGAEDRNLPTYISHRFGIDAATWGYDIPVMEPGLYGCTVHFAETESASFAIGARVFDLYLATSHGPPVVFRDVDVFAELNEAEFTVLTKTAPRLVVSGILSIRVVPSVGNAFISGITCERTADLPQNVLPDFDTDPNLPVDVVTDTIPSSSPVFPEDVGTVITGTEININVGGPAIGRFIAEDFRWVRGTTSQWGGPPGAVIGGAEEKNAPAIVSQRYGVDATAWGLVIPVQMPGLYDCSLHWAEVDSASFFVGARIFDLLIQDRADNGIDIYELAGEAPFTAVVRTYVDLQIGGNLSIALVPTVGNAFLSAITCERTADLPPGVLEDLLPQPIPVPSAEPMLPSDIPVVTLAPSPLISQEPVVESESPMPSTDFFVSPEPSMFPEPSMSLEPSGAAEPSMEPTFTPGPSLLIEPTFTPGPSLLIEPTLTAEPSLTVESTITPEPSLSIIASASPEVTGDSTALEESPSPTSEVAPIEPPLNIDVIPVENVEVDDPFQRQDGRFIQAYELRGLVTDGTEFTNEMKDIIKSISREWSNNTAQWAVLSVAEVTEKPAIRQAGAGLRTFNIDMQGLHETNEPVQVSTAYSAFISNGDADEKIGESGIDNLMVELRRPPLLAVDGPSAVASGSSTGAIVGGVVGSLLALLIIVAISAFFVVRRNRQTSGQSAVFDGPPPPMTESEVSSGVEHSETAPSVEYLDDDSTFTAATSRGGDHVDQVGFDKDVFGRGNTNGAHGSS